VYLQKAPRAVVCDVVASSLEVCPRWLFEVEYLEDSEPWAFSDTGAQGHGHNFHQDLTYSYRMATAFEPLEYEGVRASGAELL
jgi:hypothetical protein